MSSAAWHHDCVRAAATCSRGRNDRVRPTSSHVLTTRGHVHEHHHDPQVEEEDVARNKEAHIRIVGQKACSL